ncbi:hypothetical protein EJ04DRAFT_563038 [Polyplosphaeria fusca]|uniref:Uncharacterized protein n=1 Tax=Polyplosphaeria fusca TaxID=682080 RepID=A0A9P4V127_9PLEO|nr:hypothetical protein EJ04DRAFT_563038 [Polyplosphaeria fusca]
MGNPESTFPAIANPPMNIVGTTLFLSYIGLALYFTIQITTALRHQYLQIPRAKRLKARHVRRLAVLSAISFATLSFHMCWFLIRSYTRWSERYALRSSDFSALTLRTWMLDSTLFQDFASELVRDGPSSIWTQTSLLAAWFWNVWVAQEARHRGLGRQTMRSYIVLGQILPASFSATLFMIHLQLLSIKAKTNGASAKTALVRADSPKKKRKDKKSESADGTNPTQSNGVLAKPAPQSHRAFSLMLPTIMFNALLMILPPAQRSSYFIPLVLLIRFTLFLPHRIPLGKGADDMASSAVLSAGFVLANANFLHRGYSLRELARGLRTGGHAVKALAWDALISVLVAAMI